MRKLILMAAAATIITTGCGGSGKSNAEAEAAATRTDSILIKKLQQLQTDGKIAYGHHDDPSYGLRWRFIADSSDVKNVVGDYPALFSFDLGMIEWNADKNLDGVPFDYMREQIIAHDARGGINTISWHPRNPLTKGNSWDVKGDSVLVNVLKEGELNDTIKAWIGNAADFVASLKTADGKPVPVIFRPWHEHTGEWFWWGVNHCTQQEYIDLWKLTRQIFDEKGATNVVWAYSPDKSNCMTAEDYMERYPGDEYADVFGADVYDFSTDPADSTFTKTVTRMLDIATAEAAKHGKVVALTETGLEGLGYNEWYTQRLYPAIKDYPIAYVTVWRNAHADDKAGHFYAPYPGHPSAPDFVKFYNLDQMVFLNDLKK